MFTGIVEEIGVVRGAEGGRLTIEAVKVLEGTKPGDSLAVNGVCLTVTSLGGGAFEVDVMPETLSRTNLGGLRYGERVNLERALALGGRLGGHLVLGHVDDVGKVVSVAPEENARIMRIAVPARLLAYIAGKGFIAVDGVSLTVVDVDDFSLSVSLVAYTTEHTILGDKSPGSAVNVEVDVIARYLERLSEKAGQELSIDLLEKYGFTRRGI
jgi:riboflavin synthase